MWLSPGVPSPAEDHGYYLWLRQVGISTTGLRIAERLSRSQGVRAVSVGLKPRQYDKWLLSWESTKSVCKHVTNMGPRDLRSSQEGGTGECLTEELPWAHSGLP